MKVTFMAILIVGGPYDTNIKMVKILSLDMVLGCYLAQNVNLILVNTPFEQTLFT